MSDQLQPSIAVLQNGTQVVAWASNGQDGSGYGVYAQRVDGNGQPIGGEFRVNTTTGYNQDNPSVTALGNGGFMVMWAHTVPGNDGQTGIYAQRYDATGNAVGSQITMLSGPYGTGPKATLLSDGSVMAVWGGGSPKRIYGQRFDANGNATTGMFPVSPNGDQVYEAPAVTALANGGYAVTWVATHNQLNWYWDVYTQIYNSNNGPWAGRSSTAPMVRTTSSRTRSPA